MAVDFAEVAAAAHVEFGIAATFTAAGGGSPQSITVIPARPDIDTALLQTGTKDESALVDIQLADLAADPTGGALTIGAASYTIRKASRDSERLTWRCALRDA